MKTLTERYVNELIHIDFGDEIHMGCDRAYIDRPVCFPTVTFSLFDTEGLNAIADRIRSEHGYKPMYPIDDMDEKDCDDNVWYAFSIGINGFSDSGVDSSIEFQVMNTDADDDEEYYYIDLSDEEQAAIRESLDRQCRSYLGCSLRTLMAKAADEMEDCHEDNKAKRE